MDDMKVKFRGQRWWNPCYHYRENLFFCWLWSNVWSCDVDCYGKTILICI